MISKLDRTTCVQCGQHFYSDVAHTRYCSRACWDKAGRPREGSIHQPNATCQACEQAYWVQPSRLERSRFCSTECQVAFRSHPSSKTVHEPNAICEHCGTAYWIKPSLLANTRFCSRSCQDASRRGSSDISEAELTHLYYDQQLSMQQIADRLGYHVGKVGYRMRFYGLERRNLSDATYAAWNPDGDPFTIKLPETIKEKELLALAIGLYMGEGTKEGIHGVALANTNPNIHRVYIRFLTEICGVAKSKLSVSLNIFDDCDVEKAIEWWCEQLGLHNDQFFKPTVRASRGGNYTKKSVYGTITISFSNVKLKKIVDNWCTEYYSNFALNT